jgi:TatD DNase family protein
MFIDTHAHLEMVQFDVDRDEVIQRAKDAGLLTILTVGSSLEGSFKAIDIAKKYNFIHAAVGIHPHESASVDERQFADLQKLADDPDVIAIGETGLDYFKKYSPAEVQISLFKKHIRLAREIKKPVIVHCRDAWEDTLSILREEKAEEVGGIIHCFSGDRELALKCVDLGFFISFAGPLTYPKAHQLREAAKAVPSERLLTETDCPYLSPQSNRGRRNEPAFVVETAKKLAEIKGLSLEDLGRIIQKNMGDLFGSGEPDSSGKIAYQIRNSLYVNVTMRCTNDCVFCNREKSPVVAGHNLKLGQDPSVEEAIREIGEPSDYDEVVFCGYGEPTLRLDFVKEIAKWVKGKGGKVRINTNGQGNLIHKRNILPELQGLVDAMSVSLNAEDEEKYCLLCRPEFTKGVYSAVKEFISEAAKYIPEVVATSVRVPEVDIQKCKKLAEDELGVHFRVREFNVVG